MSDKHRPGTNLAIPEAPDEAQIESLLESIRPEPGKRFYQQMHAQPWLKAEPARKQPTPDRPRLGNILATSMIALLMIAFAIMATPQGQTLAQSLFRFFMPAETDSFPRPTDQFELSTVQPTIVHIPLQNPKPLQPVPLATETPSFPVTLAPSESAIRKCEALDSSLVQRCQIRQAEAEMGFDIKMLSSDPPGLVFAGVQANPALALVTVTYQTVDGGSHLIILQAQGNLYESDWVEVPSTAAVAQVKVGEFAAEYVQGMAVAKPGATLTIWEPTAEVRRLRWQEGEQHFEIALLGHVGPVEYLEQDTLVSLAESLAYTP